VAGRSTFKMSEVANISSLLKGSEKNPSIKVRKNGDA
jgi:hypothetical protein